MSFGLSGKLQTLLTRLTAARAAFLDAPISGIPTNPLITTDARLNNLNAPISGIPTNPLITNDARLNNLNAPISGIPTNPLITTDARLNNLNAPISEIPTNPLITTDARLNDISTILADTNEIQGDVNSVLTRVNSIPTSNTVYGGVRNHVSSSFQASNQRHTDMTVTTLANTNKIVISNLYHFYTISAGATGVVSIRPYARMLNTTQIRVASGVYSEVAFASDFSSASTSLTEFF